MTVVDTLKVRLELINKTSQTLLAVSNGLASIERDMRRVEKTSQGVVASQNEFKESVDNTVVSARELYYALISWGVAYSSINIARSIMETSDSISMATGRLGLLTDDVQELSDTIYQMSQDVRTNYLDMLNVVTKMGINVGVGEGEWFSNTDELVKFNELVAKTFTIGGQNTKEVNSAMLQLTQALSSGRLQGDEFRSLFENSPLYVKYIGEYLGELYGLTDKFGNSVALKPGQLKELGAQGLLTSDVLIDAMFYAADEIEERFEKTPRTFEQRFEQIRNIVQKQSENLLKTINNIVNNASFDKFLEQLTSQLTFIIGVVDVVMTALSPIIQFVLENWNIMAPLIMVVAGAMAYLAIKTELSANSSLAHAIAVRKDALALRLVSSQQKATAMGATALSIAHRLLIATMDDEELVNLRNIVIGRKKLAISKLTAFLLQHETLATWAATASTKLYNLAQGEGVIAGIARWIVGKLNVATYVQEGTAAWFATAAVNALNMAFFYILIPIALVLAVLWVILQVFNKVTGSSYSLAEVLMGALGYAVAFITNMFIGLYNAVIALANALGSLFGQKGFKKMDYVDPDEYFDRYSQKFSNNSLLNYSMDNQDYSDILSDDLMAGIDGILGNTGEIANNTSMTSQDVEFLRAMAENRVITRMNTMTINITNNNEMSVNSEMDLDGISEYMANSLTEAFSKSARGVHL